MPSYGLITRLGEPPTPSAQAFIDVLRETAGVAPDVVGGVTRPGRRMVFSITNGY